MSRSHRALLYCWLGIALAVVTVALVRLSTGPTVEWRVVASAETPIGSYQRHRPFLFGIEIRGSDRVVIGAQERFERPPDIEQWRRIELLTRVCAPACDRLRTSGLDDPHPFVLLDAEGDIRLRVEGILPADPDADAAAPRALGLRDRLPWLNDSAPLEIACDIELEIDERDGSVRWARDARHRAVSGQAWIFDPNPVVTSGDGGLRDGADTRMYRRWVETPDLDGSGRLRGSRVDVETLWPPRAEEASLTFAYEPEDARFEQAMAYAHGDRALLRAESLGFGGLFRHPVRMKVHATALDNSWYSRSDRSVSFGDGGVDDAEDADIIVHEMGHVLHDALVPGFGGGDTQAISEGFSDFWAASISGDPCIGEWDATAYAPPCLRRTDDDVQYPESMSGRPHADGRIWSALCWDLRALLGAANAERLALAAFLEQGSATRYPEAGEGLLRAARALGLIAEEPAIRELLAARGLSDRDLHFSVAAGSTRALVLHAPSRLFDRAVTALRVESDGGWTFTGRTSTGELDSLRFCPAEFLSALPSETQLDVDVRSDGRKLTIESNAHTPEGATHRTSIEWSVEEGSLCWRYLQLPETPNLTRFALQRPKQPETEFDLGALDLGHEIEFWAGRSPLENREQLIGARFRIAGSSENLRLSRIGDAFATDAPLALAAAPSPFQVRTELSLLTPEGGSAHVRVFDVAGRVVRDIGNIGMLGPGITTLSWDGRDEAGRNARAGLYVVRAEAGSRSTSVRIWKLR